MSNQAFLIFSGYNFRAVLAFCRFAKANGIPILIVACGKSDPVWLTDYSASVVATRSDHELHIGRVLSLCSKIRKQWNISLLHVLPSSEYLNRFLLRHREKLKNENVLIPLCEAPLYEQVSDKLSFVTICRQHGIDTPRQFAADEVKSYPVVIKPNAYFDYQGGVQFKPLLVSDKESHRRLQEKLDPNQIHYQEFVTGSSHYLLYYVSAAGNHVSYSQRNVIQQADGASVVAAMPSNIHNEKIAADYLELLLELDFHGLIMIEVRSTTERDVMIEANPRLWGPSQFFVDSNIPIFERFAEELNYETSHSQKVITLTDQRYFWNGGIAEDSRAGKQPSFHDYSPSEFISDYALWHASDVHLRPDSIQLYQNEIHHE